ncbi:flavin-containing amine oxidoreductase-domain containing protein [Mariannaea sp. PMI_226]|nr:flavin-containing amine oxidoreductase-domain containing protein [Mariannaea sp. PMI_226]
MLSTHSHKTSTESSSSNTPETRTEIVVWTEDMEIDDAPTHESSDSISVNLSTVSRTSSTELSELSLGTSAESSEATTPAEVEGQRIRLSDEQLSSNRQSPTHNDTDRYNFNIRPKSSIPTDISTYKYASECIIAAESSRLNPYALHPDEYHLLRHHISHAQVTTYLNIRNGILRLWLARPWIGVTRQEAVGCANARWFDAASVCYDWLVRRGYINYGCVKVPEPEIDGKTVPISKRQKTVVVIGAGLSGLGCARQLEGLFKQHADRFFERGEEPPRVVVLEGRSRVGGRVYSREFKTLPTEPVPGFTGKRHTAEMGGMIITGFDRGNPINVLLRGQLCLPYHPLTPDTTIYDINGRPVDPVRDQLVEKLYNDCLDRVSEYKHKLQPVKLIEGNRYLLEEGKDGIGDGSKTISQAEETAAALSNAPLLTEENLPRDVSMVSVSSDKLTGRVHAELGTPAMVKASSKVKSMGWTLRDPAAEDKNIDLSEAVGKENATLGSVLDSAISQYKQIVDLNAQDYRLINWHIANLEYSNATNLHNLSLGLWDIDTGNEWEGSHTMVIGGYQSVARGLVECPTSLDLKTKFPVKSISYDSDDRLGSATIECDDGSVVDADAVVCTIPLGVLKQNNITFEPALPSWKTDVIGRLGFGILNKVVLVYSKAFWDPDRDIFGVLRESQNRHSTLQKDYQMNRGRFFQWFNVSNTTGLPCLVALMAGDAGFETEHSSNNSLVTEATEVLRNVFGPKVPYPVEAVVTRWGSDRFARGSYSSAAPGMQPEDYDVMARPVGNLFFAGEHTIGTHPATVHGAYLSGLRAASEILETMIGPIEVPTPLILPRDSLLLRKRKEPIKDSTQSHLEAHELEIAAHIKSKIGDRPVRPGKVAGNAYILYSKTFFDAARKRCEENRKPGRGGRAIPNEVRVMTSKMWKEATAEERKPFEDQAAEQKHAYAAAVQAFTQAAEKWDREAIALRAAYEEAHPKAPGPGGLARLSMLKSRRARNVSYAEESDPEA